MTSYSVTTPGKASEMLTLAQILSASPKTLLYFYPKDNTPGCTLEGQDFTRLTAEFAARGIRIVGVSKDDGASHAKFQSGCGIGLPLVSDDGSLCDQFGVMGEKNMYGKKIFGMLRSSFLLDTSGKILQEWRNVRATGHAEKVLREIK